MEYKAILVDDETINLRVIKKILSNNFPQISVVGEVSSVSELVGLLNKIEPHMLFLDVNLGNKEVFEALDLTQTNAKIIFVSGEQRYALKAFRYNAVDFILKPITKDLIVTATERALSELKNNDTVDSNERKILDIYSSKYLTVSSIDKYEIFKTNEVLYFAADGRCTEIHFVDGTNIYSSKNLSEYDYLIKINPMFVKISRSYIVNFEYVKRIVKKGGPFCQFVQGTIIPISRRKLIEINKYLLNYVTA